ncbi:lysozyme inhibitor LprI family protein [Pseudomonas cremoricolorata]|uniref:lysozyme inhibitor LprI family protein n=1 Tax=Pseudomonas cremoricolorata TaxID=157783 RepID=UPI0004914905|nr:lysozyme inhibitor LprI family protein [Pseudomonas cremoricolorata]
MLKISLVTSALAAALMLSNAQAAEGSKAYTQCMDKASSTSLMSTCIQSESARQDARLNQAYKQLMGKLAAPKQKTLREVQRNWITYRDSNCTFWGRLNDGTISQLDGAMCIKDMTESRAHELERMLNPEG